MKTKFIYCLFLFLPSFLAASNETYTAPKVWLKNVNKINPKMAPSRGPSSLKKIKKQNLDSDFLTLDEIRGKKNGRKAKFWKYEMKN